jgi:RHS repeat-associated protein
VTEWRYSGNELVTIVTPRGSRTDLTLNGSGEMTGRRRRTTDTSTNDASDLVESWVWTDHFITQYTDPLSRVTDYTRDSDGNITEIDFPTVTNPASQTATKLIEYNSSGQVVETTDEEGTVTEYAYYTSGSDSGLLHTVTVDPTDLALVTTYGYDNWHNVDSITDARGNTSTRTFDALRRMIGTETPASLSYNVEMHYDGNGNLTSRAVENRDYLNNSVTANPWITTTYTYTVLDKVATMVEEVTASTTRTTSYDYDAAGNRTRVTKPEGNKVKYVYNDRQLLWKVVSGETSAVESTVENTYDDNGNLVGVKDGRGYDTTHTYDLFDRWTKTTNELGNYTEHELDKNGNTTKIQRKNSSNTELQRRTQYFDERNRLWKTSDLFKYGTTTNSDAVTTIERFKTGQVKKVTDPRGNDTTTVLDAAGRVISVEDGMGNKTSYTLDENGNQIAWEIDEFDGSTHVVHEYEATYDVLNRRLTYEEHDRLNSSTWITTTYAYDSRGNLGYEGLVNLWDIRYTYDAAGRRTKKEIGTGPVPALPFATAITTQWGFDKNDRMTSHKDDATNESTWTYDALDRPTAMVYPDSSDIAYEYDLNGNVTETTDAAGNVIEDTYDELNRRTAREVTLATGFIDTEDEAFTYDALDRLTAAEDDDYKVEYEYAVIGLQSYPWKETQSYVGGTAYAKTVTKTFDANGNVATEAYPSSLSLVRNYNDVDRLSSVTDGTNTIASFGYIGLRHKTTTFQSGATRTDTYTGYRGEVASIVHATSGSSEILRLEYGYNALHDRTYERYGGTSALGDAFAYDPARRLTTAWMGSVDVTAADTSQYVTKIVYNMDDDSNRTSVVTTPWQQSAITVTYADNSLNQYTTVGGVGQSYDGSGNLTNNGTYKFKYNYKNLVCQVKLANDTLVADYKYDALGRRVEKDVDGGVTERYIYSGVEMVSGYDGSNTWKQNFVFGEGIDEVLLLEQPDLLDYDSDSNTSEVTRSFYHRNAAGSVMDITAMDQAVEVSYRYDSYGMPAITRNSQTHSTDPLGQHWAFAGRFYDQESVSYENRARMYASGIGRFSSRDPLSYSFSMNLYEYASSNPTTFIDPLGLSAYSDRVAVRREAMGMGAGPRGGPVLAIADGQHDDHELLQPGGGNCYLSSLPGVEECPCECDFLYKRPGQKDTSAKWVLRVPRGKAVSKSDCHTKCDTYAQDHLEALLSLEVLKIVEHCGD